MKAWACDVSVVVPIFNDGDCLVELVERLVEVFGRLPYSYELVMVDDGSRDRTPYLLAQLAERFEWLRVIRLARNFGQEPAVQAGMSVSRGRWVVQLDADLQHPPEELPKLLSKAEDGYEVVYGVRKNRQDPYHRILLSKAMQFVMRRGFGIDLPEDISTFRVVDGELARFIARLPEQRKFFSALASWVGAKGASVPVEHRARASGRSSYTLAKLLSHSLDLMAGFSIRPLRIIGAAGAGFATLGILYACYKIAEKLCGVDIEMGYTSLFSAIVIIGGVNLIALSVIGEYVGRVFLETQGRPPYRILEDYGAGSETSVGSHESRPMLGGPAVEVRL